MILDPRTVDLSPPVEILLPTATKLTLFPAAVILFPTNVE